MRRIASSDLNRVPYFQRPPLLSLSAQQPSLMSVQPLPCPVPGSMVHIPLLHIRGIIRPLLRRCLVQAALGLLPRISTLKGTWTLHHIASAFPLGGPLAWCSEAALLHSLSVLSHAYVDTPGGHPVSSSPAGVKLSPCKHKIRFKFVFRCCACIMQRQFTCR